VEIRTVEGGTRVRIRDDGRGLPQGFGAAPHPGHMGLMIMEERARLAGGWWRISAPSSGGTAVEFWVPGLDRRPLLPESMGHASHSPGVRGGQPATAGLEHG